MGYVMFRQVQIVVLTLTALMPLLIAVAIAASAPQMKISPQATDIQQSWSYVRYAAKAGE